MCYIICLQKKKKTKANKLRNRTNLENMCVPSEYAFLFLLHKHHNLPYIFPSTHCIKTLFLNIPFTYFIFGLFNDSARKLDDIFSIDTILNEARIRKDEK
jgi:hypothetical protein